MTKIEKISELKPRRNASNKYKSKLPSHRLPQFLIFSPILSSLHRSVLLIPSILERLETISKAMKFKNDFNIDFVPVSLLVEALTAPGANVKFGLK